MMGSRLDWGEGRGQVNADKPASRRDRGKRSQEVLAHLPDAWEWGYRVTWAYSFFQNLSLAKWRWDCLSGKGEVWASCAFLRVHDSYESVGPDAFDLRPSLDTALLYVEGTEDVHLILES